MARLGGDCFIKPLYFIAAVNKLLTHVWGEAVWCGA